MCYVHALIQMSIGPNTRLEMWRPGSNDHLRACSAPRVLCPWHRLALRGFFRQFVPAIFAVGSMLDGVCVGFGDGEAGRWSNYAVVSVVLLVQGAERTVCVVR
jgi:hypothetical protein